MGAAARLYCAANPAGALPWLRERLSIDSPHDELRGALLGLIATQRGVELDELRRWALDEGAEHAVRVPAVQGMARIGRGSSRVRDDIAGLLSTRDCRLRPAVIEALGSLRDPALVPTLAAHHAVAADPRERRAIERLLREEWAR